MWETNCCRRNCYLKCNDLLHTWLAFVKWFLKSSHCYFPGIKSYVTSKNLCDSKYIIDTAASLSCSCRRLSGNESLSNRYFANELKFHSVFSIICSVSINTSLFSIIHYGIICGRISVFYLECNFSFSFQSRIVLFEARLVWKIFFYIFYFVTEIVDIVSQQLVVYIRLW